MTMFQGSASVHSEVDVDWANERYVRVYTRDTLEWLALSWQARGLACLLFRKLDRAGVIELGRVGLKGLAALVHAPWRDIKGPLDELLEDGCFEVRNGCLIAPNFIEAQEARASGAERMRAMREKRRDVARAGDVLIDSEDLSSDASSRARDNSSQNVTKLCNPVTPNQPSRTVPDPPSGGERPGQLSLTPPDPKPPRRKRKAEPKRSSPYAAAWEIWRPLWSERWEVPYPSGPGDGNAIGRLWDSAKEAAEVGPDGVEPADVFRHWVKAYLADRGFEAYLERERHPLRTLHRSLTRYGMPWEGERPEPGIASPEIRYDPPVAVNQMGEDARRAREREPDPEHDDPRFVEHLYKTDPEKAARKYAGTKYARKAS